MGSVLAATSAAMRILSATAAQMLSRARAPYRSSASSRLGGSKLRRSWAPGPQMVGASGMGAIGTR